MKLQLKKKTAKLKKAVSKKVKAATKAVKNAAKKLAKALSLKRLVVIAGLVIVANYVTQKTTHPRDVTVMITNIEGTGGGSGVVVENTQSESLILTNNHVCQGALAEGGKVVTVDKREHLVTGFYTSVEHDLCLVTVSSDLGASVTIAEKTPKMYEKATITGHPSLMPNVVTTGHFSGNEIIQLIVGVRKCTEKDADNPDAAEFCAFFGVAPIIRNFSSTAVSATIMPGSSGSAVLNENGELAGLVFAGKGRGLSYAYIVPLEAIQNFMAGEYPKERPWEMVDQNEEELSDEEGFSVTIKSMQEKCLSEKTNSKNVKTLCKQILEQF